MYQHLNQYRKPEREKQYCRKLNQWQGQHTWQTSLEVINKVKKTIYT